MKNLKFGEICRLLERVDHIEHKRELEVSLTVLNHIPSCRLDELVHLFIKLLVKNDWVHVVNNEYIFWLGNFIIPAIKKIFQMRDVDSIFNQVFSDKEMLRSMYPVIIHLVSDMNVLIPTVEQSAAGTQVIKPFGKIRLKLIQTILEGCGTTLFFNTGCFAQAFKCYSHDMDSESKTELKKRGAIWSKTVVALILKYVNPKKVDALIERGHFGMDGIEPYLKQIKLEQAFRSVQGVNLLFANIPPIRKLVAQYYHGEESILTHPADQELRVLGGEIDRWLKEDETSEFVLEPPQAQQQAAASKAGMSL